MILLLACSNWVDQKPSCNLDVYDWSDDLLAHILTGSGDGSFDYDPEDVPRKRLAGKYNYNTGDFSWSVDYADEYWLTASEVEGYGTAYHDGDLDIYYTETFTDILDETWSTSWRVTRTGCSMQAEAFSEGESEGLVRVGEYTSDDGYAWDGDLGGYHYHGGMRQNLSRTLGIEAEDGSYTEAGTYKPEGTADITWSGGCSTSGRYTCEVEEKRRFDGGTDLAATMFDRKGDVYADVVATTEYNGAGVYTYAYATGETCDYVYTAGGGCTYACSDGTDGDCS